jgi:hypothetical protein
MQVHTSRAQNLSVDDDGNDGVQRRGLQNPSPMFFLCGGDDGVEVVEMEVALRRVMERRSD